MQSPVEAWQVGPGVPEKCGICSGDAVLGADGAVVLGGVYIWVKIV